MTDPAITNALAQRKHLEEKLAECEARAKRVRAQLSDINKFISQWEKLSGQPAFNSVTTVDKGNLSQNNTDSGLSSRLRNPKKEKVATLVREILEERGRPMMRADLYKALQSRGIQIYGNDPEMVLSTMLWRVGEEFKIGRLKSGGYWLSDRAAPEVQTEIDTRPIKDVFS
ncbi:hypothetical protein RZS28_13805 [Methylocapsa polymorpha]|uniref:HTH HARE-type domain-containing protein n=1 Tax=Methylocapsa polymorpha TaxID=3080828 RepID=A0ABZ0HSI5_9HYPH|nr:hypothetical protein RZS28_13805 [Methylocapsa sp. RX1]